MSEQGLSPLGDRHPDDEWLNEHLRVDDATTAYAILGLSEGVPFKQVRRAYLERVRAQHPDRRPRDPASQEKAERATRLIIEAYMFLYQRDAPSSAGIPGWADYPGPAYARVEASPRSGMPAYHAERPMIVLLVAIVIAMTSLIAIPALLIFLIDALL
ncbi:MAG: J domain-containing protein [Chloroflexi bacterium]|nr:J domain-containing protein [Chloroflexota bacterium]